MFIFEYLNMSRDTFFASGSVGIISQSLLRKVPPLLEKLNQLSVACSGHELSICGPYEECEVDFAFYLDYFEIGKEGENLPLSALPNQSETIIKHVDKIRAFLSCVNVGGKGKTAEIYDVCTDPKFRKRGYMRDIFSKLEMYLIYNGCSKIWLGIDLRNPLWEGVLKLYVSLGFKNPKITKRSSMDKPISFKALRLVKNIRENDLEQNKILLIANELRNDYLASLADTSFIKIIIPKSLCLALKNAYINKGREYAGIFLVDSKRNIENFDFYSLAYPVDSQTGGSWTHFIVNSPRNFAFSFHTHPDICYSRVNCYIGWPSGMDMRFVTECYDLGTRKHFVITKEGIYSIQMTKQFSGLWRLIKSQDCKNIISYLIGEIFAQFEKFRQKEIIKLMNNLGLLSPTGADLHRITQTTLMEYNKIVQQTTFHQLLKLINNKNFIKECIEYYKDVDDFILFNVSFANWQHIENGPGFIDNLYIYIKHNTPKDINVPIITFKPQLSNRIYKTIEDRFDRQHKIFYYKRPVIPTNATHFDVIDSAPQFPPAPPSSPVLMEEE